MASRKPRVPRYPARFSLCRLVTTAGRMCPQPVNLHLQEEWVVPDHLDHQKQRQKRENNPPPPKHTNTTTPTSLPSRKGRGNRTGRCPRHRPAASYRLESWGYLSAIACQSDRRWDFSFLSPPSQSVTALSFASCKRPFNQLYPP